MTLQSQIVTFCKRVISADLGQLHEVFLDTETKHMVMENANLQTLIEGTVLTRAKIRARTKVKQKSPDMNHPSILSFSLIHKMSTTTSTQQQSRTTVSTSATPLRSYLQIVPI